MYAHYLIFLLDCVWWWRCMLKPERWGGSVDVICWLPPPPPLRCPDMTHFTDDCAFTINTQAISLCIIAAHLLCCHRIVSLWQSTTWRSPCLSRSNTWLFSSSWNPSAHLAIVFVLWRYPPSGADITGQREEEVGRQHQEKWTGQEFGKSQRVVENREKWRKLVAKSSLVPQRPSRLRDW